MLFFVLLAVCLAQERPDYSTWERILDDGRSHGCGGYCPMHPMCAEGTPATFRACMWVAYVECASKAPAVDPATGRRLCNPSTYSGSSGLPGCPNGPHYCDSITKEVPTEAPTPRPQTYREAPPQPTPAPYRPRTVAPSPRPLTYREAPPQPTPAPYRPRPRPYAPVETISRRTPGLLTYERRPTRQTEQNGYTSEPKYQYRPARKTIRRDFDYRPTVRPSRKPRADYSRARPRSISDVLEDKY